MPPSKNAFSRTRAILALAVLATAIIAGLQGRAVAEDGGAFEIAEAPPLTWGFKTSWRGYAGQPEVSGGAAVRQSDGNLEWAFQSGAYDAESGITRLSYEGTAHWKGHLASAEGRQPPPGYTGEPDPYLLDVTFTDPQVAIGPEESVLTAVMHSRNLGTWEMIDYGRVPLVNLDVLEVTPTTAGGTTQWSGIPTTLVEQGRQAFAGFYLAGQAVDPVSFSYTGPGGAPDFSEHWDQPGTIAIEQVQNALFIDEDEGVQLDTPGLVDPEHMIVHSMRTVTVDGVLHVRFEAFSLRQMQPIGEPFLLPRAQSPSSTNIAAYDSNQDRWLYPAIKETGMPRWIKFNLETGKYEAGVFSDPQLVDKNFIGTQKLAWDPSRDRGYRIQRVVPEGVGSKEFDLHEWRLITYEEGEGGIWVKRSFPIDGFPAGQNETGYALSSSYTSPTYATASDGSLIVLATTRKGLAETDPIAGAYRLVIDDEDESVQVQPLPVQVENSISGIFTSVQASANGHVLLISTGGGANVVHCQIMAVEQVDCDSPVSIEQNVEPGLYRAYHYALDPTDGTIWFAGYITQQLAAIRDGSFLGAQFFSERNPEGGPILVDDDGTVYAQSSDGAPDMVSASKTWGYAKYEEIGLVPTVTAQPQDGSALLGVGEASEEVAFSSTASGTPSPSRQWQVKAPGSQRFVDIPDETGPTLTVDATRSDDGAEYRAIHENAAGKVASDPAELSVSYAPLLLTEAVGVSATEGEPAKFLVLGGGNPEPAVTWQRRVGGFWQDVDADDENFAIEGPALTVLETNAEQSGALFRAKLTNSQGTVHSKAAKLTVTPRVSIPEGGLDFENVSMQWTGNLEMQKAPPFGGSNYFSAGTSAGDEATYRSVADSSAVFQVASGGAESVATWPTRAAHVGSGGEQLVRLYGGEGRVEADGSASVSWNGSFSVNFYGGLVPFTFADPELTIDGDGSGTLSADLSGYASSQANPDQRSPLETVPDVTIATFSGVEVDPTAELTIEPDYAGVEADVPVPFAPQDRVASGWGAWPQPFVDFHAQTGLAPYWYSSGGAADPDKAPNPFAIDFEGQQIPEQEEPEEVAQPDPRPSAAATPRGVTEGGPATISAAKVVSVRRGHPTTLATLDCPTDGFCAVAAPRRVKVRIGGQRYWLKVIAPGTIDAGGEASIRLRLSDDALHRLAGHRTTARFWVRMRSQGGTITRFLAVELSR